MLTRLRKRIREQRRLWKRLGPAAPLLGCILVVSILLRPVFFILGLPFRIKHALRRRAFRTGHTIEQPPFPKLTWTECDWWDGKLELAGWSDFRLPDSTPAQSSNVYSLTVLPTDQRHAALPSAEQTAALSHLQSHSEAIALSVCEAVLPFYNKAFAAEEGFFEELSPISTPAEVRGLISLNSVYIQSTHRDGMALVGLGFACAWDEEHGFGVLLHGSTVLEIGADEFF